MATAAPQGFSRRSRIDGSAGRDGGREPVVATAAAAQASGPAACASGSIEAGTPADPISTISTASVDPRNWFATCPSRQLQAGRRRRRVASHRARRHDPQQIVTITFGQHDEGDHATLNFRSTCGPATDQNAAALLRYNAKLVQGAFAFDKIGDREMVLLQASSRRHSDRPRCLANAHRDRLASRQSGGKTNWDGPVLTAASIEKA